MKRNPTAERIRKRVKQSVKFKIQFYLANNNAYNNRPILGVRKGLRKRPRVSYRGRRTIPMAKINHLIDKVYNRETDTVSDV